MLHQLKTDTIPFKAVWDGTKKCELRKNDRNFAIEDFVLLREIVQPDPKQAIEYTGRQVLCRITHIVKNPSYGLQDGYVVFSFETLTKGDDGQKGRVP